MSNGYMQVTGGGGGLSRSGFGSPARSVTGSFGTIVTATPPARAAKDVAFDQARAGDALTSQGMLRAAQARYAEAVRLYPQEAQFHWLLGLSHWRLGEVDEAGPHLQAAVRIDPHLHSAQSAIGSWYLNLGMVTEALDATAKSLEGPNPNLEIIECRAWALEAAGELDECWKLIQQLFDHGRSNGLVSVSVARLFGRISRYRGRQDEALSMLLNLLRMTGISPINRSGLHFAAADLLDHAKRYDEAFHHVAQGNLLRKPADYNAAMHAQTFERIAAFYSKERLASLAQSGVDDERPVFIVGMPRSGTTLVEQILASHHAVHGAGELDFMYRVCEGAVGMAKANIASYPLGMENLSNECLDGLAQIYLEPLSAMNPAAKRVVDKMPLNFMHIGLIRSLLPGAKIIHCRRNAMDTCLSCHMTAFNSGNDFKYDLAHLGAFYRTYDRLMDHWRRTIDLPMLDVQYEDLIADPETHARKLIDFVGLEWDANCLKHHETKRSACTASVQQVRQPIYKSSAGRWKNYEKHLGPLKAALHVA